MGKNLRKNGMVTIYIRNDFRPIFEEFTVLVNKDKEMKRLQFKARDSLISIGIFKLIADYVSAQKKKGNDVDEDTDDDESDVEVEVNSGEV